MVNVDGFVGFGIGASAAVSLRQCPLIVSKYALANAVLLYEGSGWEKIPIKKICQNSISDPLFSMF